VRSYAFERGDEPDAELQYAALSATIDPTAGGRYFDDATVLQTRGGRAIDAEVLKLAPDSAELAAYLAAFRERSWRKALAFCNSRAEVEAHAAAIRERSPFGDAVYVHYSNIEAHRRREIERQFAEAGAAICFASSTLELGIDIGDIDVVLLLGPPGSRASFLQRIGRGNRRGGTMHVACFWHTPLERLMFEALLGDDQSSAKDESLHDIPASPASFRPAVAIQQIFSLLKQSPVAAVRLVELAQLFEGMLSSDDVLAILGELQQRDYLRAGRPGEWGAGQRLNKLFDQQASAQPEISIYSNIQGGQRQIEIRDQYTQRTVARVDVAWLGRETLTLEGRALSVEWCDGEAVWVTAQQRRELPDRPIYRSARQLLSYELAAHLPAHLGLPPGATPVVRAGVGWYWFHWLGDLYGRAVLDLLRYTLPAEETTQPGLCLRLAEQPQAMPIWSAAQVTRYLEDHFRQFEAQLDLGPFQTLLPLRLRRRAVVEQFGIERFLDVLAAQQLLVAPETLSEDLAALLLSEGDNATE
jgi:Lhr-like helicase